MTAVNDISPEMVSISRMIDRLPPGIYVIELDKPLHKRGDWSYSIERKERVREGKLERNKNGDANV